MGSWLSQDEFNSKACSVNCISFFYLLPQARWTSITKFGLLMCFWLWMLMLQIWSSDVFPASGFANCDQTVCIKWPCHSSWTIATYWEFWWWFIYSSSWRAGQLSYICASAYPSGLIYIWLLGSCKCHLLTRCVLAWVSGFPTCCHWICRHICFSTRANTQVHACNCSQGQWCRWQMKAGKWIFEQWFMSFHLHSWNRWWGVLGLLAFPVGKILCPRSVGTNVFVLGGWLIGQLSQRTLTGSLLKHLSKLQVCTS